MWSGWLDGWSSGPGLKWWCCLPEELERLEEAQRGLKVPSGAGVTAAGKGASSTAAPAAAPSPAPGSSENECLVSQCKELQGRRCHSAGGL